MTNIPLADLALARSLERTEARGNASYVETKARVFPGCGSEWIEVAGAFAIFDGPASPLTQTFGLGMFAPLTGDELDELEAFFREREAPVFHEVSPLADEGVLEQLNERGYRPIELTSVMYRPIEENLALAAQESDTIRVRAAEPGEEELWARTATEGWSEYGDLSQLMSEVARVTAARDDAYAFLAELDGQAIAAGGLNLWDEVALLAGASTIPSGRRQGAQLALLEARLRVAAEHGCKVAAMSARPGSASQRNAERHGFRIAYTRIKWELES